MTMPHDIDGPDTWAVDLRRKRAVHKSGFIVFMAEEPGSLKPLRSNAESWVQVNFAERAPLIPALLRAAVTAYQRARKKREEKKA